MQGLGGWCASLFQVDRALYGSGCCENVLFRRQASNKMKIFDSHIHVGDKTPISFPIENVKFLKDIMRAEGIDGAVVIPTEPSIEENRKIFNQCKGESNLYPFCWYSEKRVLEDLEDYQEEIYGLKYHPSISQRAFSGDDPIDGLALSICAYLNVPLLIHCGRDPKSSTRYVFPWIKLNPDVNFILAHFGGMIVDKIEHTIDLYNKFGKPKNIYFDLANGRHPWILRDFVNRFGSEQLLFGTDMPFVDFKLTLMNVKLAGLKPKDEENILWNNAQRVICKLDTGQ